MEKANKVKKLGSKWDTQIVAQPKPRLPEAVPARNDSMFRLPEGFFKLPPNFRNYAKFISYGWGGFAVVATAVCAGTWVQHRLESEQRDSQEEAISTRR